MAKHSKGKNRKAAASARGKPAASAKTNTADFLFELGMLKNLPRSGWLTIGIKGCESVAEHSFRTAAIAYVLAKSEKLSSEKLEQVLAAAIFHDLAETRTGDLHLVNKNYCKADSKKATDDILSGCDFARELKSAANDPLIKAIVEDADKLELVLQALEYAESGEKRAISWANSASKRIKTKAGKKLLAEIKRTPASRWLFSIRN